MGIRKSDVMKIVLPSILVMLIFTLIYLHLWDMQNKEYTRIFNNNMQKIIIEIQKEYPNVSEEEVIRILQDKSVSAEEGKKILQNYGYDENQVYIENINKSLKNNQIKNIYFIVSFGIVMLAVSIIYIIKQNKSIRQIDQYLKKVNNGNYNMKIEDNHDDELSKLRNDLYKTTVLLREAAENSKKESENLSNSLADISHQLKTPITSISIMIDNICENSNMDEETRMDFLKTIRSQIDWISSLVISLLKLSKFDSGTIIMNDNKILASKLINDVIQNLSILLEIKNIEAVCKVDEKAELVADYKWQLEAISNIVKNAIEHSRENSKIYITVENTSVFLKIEIKDEGLGISKEDIRHIFERFYKAKNSSENSIGIGLSLAKTIIEKDNGYITVDSKEGEGTTFAIKYLK